jgi:pimeloyl-ACP methyl ester carboxylesterase
MCPWPEGFGLRYSTDILDCSLVTQTLQENTHEMFGQTKTYGGWINSFRNYYPGSTKSMTSILAAALIVIFMDTPVLARKMTSQDSVTQPYDNETMIWHTCIDLEEDFECSTISVPMDHFDPLSSLDRSFTIPIIRLRGRNGDQNVLLNPGGPGASGLDFLQNHGRELRTIVGEEFHLVSFDPRGTGQSRPLASCFPEGQPARASSQARSNDVILDGPEIYAWTQNYVRACRDSSHYHGRYVNTPQIAADMNTILDFLGQEFMIYWGFSYGTVLGQTYAMLFPERSHRIIIDGVVDMRDWYESLLDFGGLSDAEDVLEGFLDECVKAGPSCSLSSHAVCKEDLAIQVEKLLTGLKDQPWSVYINESTYGVLTHDNLLYDGIFPALYRPATWPRLANCLSDLLNGNATEAFLEYGNSVEWIANDFITMNDGASGPEHWPQDRKSIVDELVPQVSQSIFGSTEIARHYKKQQWKIPKTHHFTPKTSVQTAYPLLILSMTFDPICPLQSAKVAKTVFAGSQVIELMGYGHCTTAMPSLCVARHVRRFLQDGLVPSCYTKCAVDKPYFGMGTHNVIHMGTAIEDVEDLHVHAAQVRVANDKDWHVTRD